MSSYGARRPTRTVMVGNVGVGGNNPVRIQSMTTSNTRDAAATIDQIIRLADTGCEIARITVQGIKEADACEEIKNGLIRRGYDIPLVADIHFYPPAAMRVVDFVDKVRINPGNFVDKRASFKIIEYDDVSYQKEIEKIEEKFTPLVEKCKSLKRAMRIGTNHGSLSDRIMNRYGDTPAGMVESAFEFAQICRKYDYHDIIFSMKSSNPKIMIQAYRLLVERMDLLGWDYPLHLGVTEAGEGEDGRVKSAMGIGTLLLEGIGDTIRVSLTEDPWFEIDPCKRLIQFAEESVTKANSNQFIKKSESRSVIYPKGVALHRDGSVFVNVKEKDITQPEFYRNVGCDVQLSKPKLRIDSADHLMISEPIQAPELKKKIDCLKNIGIGITSSHPIEGTIRLLSISQAVMEQQARAARNRFLISFNELPPNNIAIRVQDEPSDTWPIIADMQPALIFLSPSKNRLETARSFFEWLQQNKITIPVIINFQYDCSIEDLIIRVSAEYGALFCDGLGEGILIDAPGEINFLRTLSFNILQSARMRVFKTDFISCPSCGRTLFNLQDVTRRIRERTSHLPGVKIAIMGCIVNGPGEMADADFGYVGSKPGMIDLYVGKKCVERDISFDEADDRLIELIKSHGRWEENT